MPPKTSGKSLSLIHILDNSELDDMVLIKSDGYPTYNFANVVDDHLMSISHVVRGNEYLSSSPKYNRLYEAFGWEVPVYVHCPLITDENHHKLSKRSGHSSFEDLLEQGFLSEAVVNYVALLGWSPEDNREIFSLEEMVKEFDYRRMSKSPAVFDMTKLRWMNLSLIHIYGMFVARGVSESALAAVNIVSPFVNFLFSVSILFAVGTSTIVAIYLGQGKHLEANQANTQNLIVSAAVSLLITVVMWLGVNPAVRFLGATEATMEYARHYICLLYTSRCV